MKAPLLQYVKKLVHMMPASAAPYDIYYLPDALKREGTRQAYGLYIVTGKRTASTGKAACYADLGVIESGGRFVKMLTWSLGPSIGRAVSKDGIGHIGSVGTPNALVEYINADCLVKELALVQGMDYIGLMGPSSALLSDKEGSSVLMLDKGHPFTGIGSCLVPEAATDNVFTKGDVQDDDEDEDYSSSSSLDEDEDEDNGDETWDWENFDCDGDEVRAVSYDKKKLVASKGAGPALKAYLENRSMRLPAGLKMKADDILPIPASPDKADMLQMYLKGLMI